MIPAYRFLQTQGFRITLTEDRKVRVECAWWAHKEAVSTFSFGEDFTLEEALSDHTTQDWLCHLTGIRIVTKWEFQ